MDLVSVCSGILHAILIWSYYVHANILFNLIGQYKKPSSNVQPYKSKYVDFQQQCFAQCTYSNKCYSFALDKKDLYCHFYNVSISSFELVPSPDTDYYSEFRDCQDWYNFGARKSGVYKVNWMGRMMKDVRCNTEIEGGGWLTFQRRFDGSVEFYEPGTWDVYKKGFGKPSGEMWLGNDFLHEITSSGDYYVFILATYNGESQVSKYEKFHIDSESNKYQLHFNETLIKGKHSLFSAASNLRVLNKQYFSSKGMDNDRSPLQCYSHSYERGPFWYKYCSDIWPNRRYGNGDGNCGMRWNSWKSGECLKSIEMMVKKM